MNPDQTVAETPTEAKLRIDGQWFYRGNRSPMWLACASRSDGSMSGISDKVEPHIYPILERVAALEIELAAANAALKHYRKLSNHMTNWAVEQDHSAAIEKARKG